jgi:hypothetical protein
MPRMKATTPETSPSLSVLPSQRTFHLLSLVGRMADNHTDTRNVLVTLSPEVWLGRCGDMSSIHPELPGFFLRFPAIPPVPKA